jgi:hypothetical protein
MAAFVGMLALTSSMVVFGDAGQTQQTQTAAEMAKPSPYIFGARYCASCHARDNKYTNEERARMICRMDEFTTFSSDDPHKLAFVALTGARGKRMSKLLKTDVKKIDACVNCHSVPKHGIKKQEYTREQDGVTCVACHGASKEWVERHPATADDEWRNLDRQKQESVYGMTNLWDPVRRAEVCASCHIGNQAQGKVVTHAMYAAGHPPLPSFEAATFGDAQPRHGQSVREKLLLPERAKRIKPTPDANNLEQSKLVAVSGLVVLRESMRLFSDLAAADHSDGKNVPWPDYAQFDCSACHHDLLAGGSAPWRQTRGFAAAPGRPPAPEWPLALVGLGVMAASPERAAERNSELNRHLETFRHALAIQPFGEAEARVPVARSIVRWADAVLDDLRSRPVNRQQARALLEWLCSTARERTPDYDSARQIAWAFRIIYNELEPDRAKDMSAPITRILAELDTHLLLTLSRPKETDSVEKVLIPRLRAIACYDPAAFEAQVGAIEKALVKSK